MNDLQARYKTLTTSALASFQLLEFLLKSHIGMVYAFIGHKLDDEVPFSYTKSDVESFALERLLGVFAKLNGNEDLKGRLNKLKDRRNFVAHRALLSLIEAAGMPGLSEEDVAAMYEVDEEVMQCLRLLLKEFELVDGNVRMHLKRRLTTRSS